LRDAVELGVKELTIYAFSTENWLRSDEEVRSLMLLLGEYVDRITPELHAKGVRLRFLGRHIDPVPREVIEKMERAERLTAENTSITLFVPFNYGGRAEILDAARDFTGTTEEEFRQHLYAPEMHDPELVIRTSGEQRLSNYLLWQVAHAELIFCDELWPDFSRASFERTIAEFQRRRRKRST